MPQQTVNVLLIGEI